MDKVGMVKKEVQMQNWSEAELARQESGLTVTQWCRQERISTSTYYYRLRKIRESLCEQIPVPVNEITEKTETDHAAIRIVSGDLKVEMSSDVPSEKIAAIATVYIVTGYTDMRKGIDGLAQIVEGTIGKDVYSKAVYLFCGRNNTKMKALVWDGDGFLLLYKRLDNGRYRWPRTECEAKQLTSQQLRWLMEGLEIEQKKAIKPGQRKCLY